MYDHEIKEMREVLVKAGVLKPKEKKFIAIMQEYWSDKTAIVWNTDDVHFAVNQNHEVVSEEVARNALQSVLHKHDASIGVSWDTLAEWAEPIRKMTAKESAWYDVNSGQDDTRIIDGATYMVRDSGGTTTGNLMFDQAIDMQNGDAGCEILLDKIEPKAAKAPAKG